MRSFAVIKFAFAVLPLPLKIEYVQQKLIHGCDTQTQIQFFKTLFEQLLKKSIIFAKTNLFGQFPLGLFLKGLGGFDSWNKKYCLFKASQTYCKTNFDKIITKCVSWFFYIGFIVMDAIRICLIFLMCDGSYNLWNKIRKN